MRLFNSEVGNHSREYTQGNLGQNVSDINTSMFPVALLTLGKLTYMKKKNCGVSREHKILSDLRDWGGLCVMGECGRWVRFLLSVHEGRDCE